MDITNNRLEVKPYTKKELAAIYCISVRSLSNWVNKFPEVGPKNGKYYTVIQVRTIIEKLGTIGEQIEPSKTQKQKAKHGDKNYQAGLQP
jgi:hypothetical protein